MKTAKPAILIVDDELSILESFRLLLEKEGLEVFTAIDSKNAFSILNSNWIGIVLLDLKLGKENGVEIGKKIINLFPQCKVILLTAYPTFDVAIEATRSGFFYLLEKSSPSEVIVNKIREAVRSEETSGKKISDGKQKNCLRFITICRHSLIIDQIKKISEENICLDYSGNFDSIQDIARSGYQKETDLAMVCASCSLLDKDTSILLIKDLYTLFPFIKIIIFNENYSDGEKAWFIKLGVKGLFGSDITSGLLQKALLVIRDGGLWAERKILNIAVEPDAAQITRMLSRNEHSYGLSIREKEILRTLVLGIRNKDIADRLYISEKTVKTHVNRIFKKLGVDSRVKAILKAKEENLV